MNSMQDSKHMPSSDTKKSGRNLLCEILTFFLVFAACTVGNLLIVIIFAERFLIPQLGSITDSADSMEIIEGVLSSPDFSVMLLFSTAATIVVVILFGRLVQKRSWDSLGMSRAGALRQYIRGIFFGGIAISALVAVCSVMGAGYFADVDHSPISIVLLFLPAYLIQGTSEELLCRGYFMNSVARRYPMWVAVVFSSVVFALLHMPNNGVTGAAFLNLFLFGVFAALMSIRTGSIWCASGFHFAWNFFQGVFYGINVSGMDMHAFVFRFVSVSSWSRLNGGDFGMEGGFLCTAFLALGILCLGLRMHKDAHISRI